MREDRENFKVLFVLPSDHHVVKSLILCKHKDLGYPKVQSLMVALGENYCVVKSRRTIKKETRYSSKMDLDRIKPTDKTELNKRLVYKKRLMSDLRAGCHNEYL
ncbi:integrase catalytic domain-containing protein, partial [Nephila pilipes]